MSIEFTAFYAGLLSLIYIALTIRIIQLRWKHKVGIGHGESTELHRAIRVHGNFSEYVPLALVLMLLLELQNTAEGTLHLLGAMLLIGRVFHAMGLGKRAGTSLGRTIGGICTYLMIIVAAILNVMSVY